MHLVTTAWCMLCDALQSGATPLWAAAQAGWPEVVEALIDAGADKDVKKVRAHNNVPVCLCP